MTKQNEIIGKFILILTDLALFFSSYFIAFYIRFYSGFFAANENIVFEVYFFKFFFFSYIFVIIMYMFNLYSIDRNTKLYNQITNIFISALLTSIFMLFILYLLKDNEVSRWFIFIFYFVLFLIISIFRLIIKIIYITNRNNTKKWKRIIIIGVNEISYEYYTTIVKNKRYGIAVKHILSDDNISYEDMKATEKLEKLECFLEQNNVDQVVIGIKLKEYDKLDDIIGVCEKHGVKSSIIPEYQKYLPARPSYEEVGSITLVNTRAIPLDDFPNKQIKHFLDIIVSLILIIILTPIYLLLSILIKLTSKGPIIFKQQRVGYGNKEFTMYKFRTMRTDANMGNGWTTKNDPRTTGIGKILRKTSLDEIPQLFNVIAGNMSLVGPRPELKFFVDKFTQEIPKYNIKHRVKPGITGLAQINGYRGDTSILQRINYDIYYIEEWTLQLDIYILLRTFFYGFLNRNE